MEDELLDAREICIREFNSLRGRLCNAIESIGLPPQQEKSLLILVKHLSYQNQAVVAELVSRLDDGSSQFRYNKRIEKVA